MRLTRLFMIAAILGVAACSGNIAGEGSKAWVKASVAVSAC